MLAVNKDKLVELQIPDGFSNAGTTTNVTLKNDDDNRKMYLGDAPTEHDSKLAYDLFWLMME